MKKILKMLLATCGWVFLALVVLNVLATLLVPMWYVLLATAGGLTILSYQRKRHLWRPIGATLAIALLTYYFAFEFIPFGGVSGDKTVRGVAFKDIAGSYYHGDGLGMNCSLELTPDGRFFFTWTGCLGVYDRNKGAVTVEEESIILHPKKPNRRDGFRGTPTVFVPVKWGTRMYLVPSDRMVEFCSEVNAGREPRKSLHGRFYLRRQDWKSPCIGWPALEDRWLAYLLSEPVRGRIIRLRDNRTGILDLGTNSGLRAGMTLTAQSGDNYLFSQVEVESASATESVVKCLWQDSSIHSSQLVTSKFYEDEGASNNVPEDTPRKLSDPQH